MLPKIFGLGNQINSYYSTMFSMFFIISFMTIFELLYFFAIIKNNILKSTDNIFKKIALDTYVNSDEKRKNQINKFNDLVGDSLIGYLDRMAKQEEKNNNITNAYCTLAAIILLLFITITLSIYKNAYNR